MRRREFITLFGSVVLCRSRLGLSERCPVIGFLHEGLPAPAHLTAAFRLGLVEAGLAKMGHNRKPLGRRSVRSTAIVDGGLIEHRAEVIAAAYLVAARAAKAVTSKYLLFS